MVATMTYEKDRNWTSRVPIRQVVVGQPFHTYCNMGVGDHFYHAG